MNLAGSLKFSKHFKIFVRRLRHFYFSNLDPVDFTKSYVTLRKYPAAWTPGNRVKIVWDPAQLAVDQPVTIQIITLVLNPLGIVQARATITVIKEQENTGNAEFNLPDLFNERSVVSNHRCLCFQFFSGIKVFRLAVYLFMVFHPRQNSMLHFTFYFSHFIPHLLFDI